MQKILIIGAGPTGLGCGYRLQELGHKNFQILERNDYIGGLSASFRKDGFTFDIGGHVLFSHYPYFDKIVDDLLNSDFQEIMRKAYIWIQERFMPYPFQNNIRHLNKQTIFECLEGLIDIQKQPDMQSANFEEWVLATFGTGIAKYFMLPYNYKVWAHPPKTMSKDWIAERVSIIDLKEILKNIILAQDEASWGPNNTFKFPLYGGTGGLFTQFNKYLKYNIRLDAEVTKIDNQTKTVYLKDGSSIAYDILINTSPLDKFMNTLSQPQPSMLSQTKNLLHNGVYAVGIGVKNKKLDDKCWMYFPEDNCPFYRVTYLSNYSPKLTPGDDYVNLLAEVSYSTYKKEDPTTIIKNTIQGMLNTQLLTKSDIPNIACKAVFDADYAYPIPSLERDSTLNAIIPYLEQQQIYSRGRFGLWRYETGNMDHSVMQGVELIDYILNQTPETTRYLK